VIASVAGRVVAVAPEQVVVEVGGVGLAVQCTPGTLAGLRPGETTRLATSLVVREDSLTLYGFADEDERAVFELVQTASGVGPRLAQAMLAVHSPDGLRRAVAAEDLTALTLVPGIGRKGAQRIVLELKDRLGAPVGRVPQVRRTDDEDWRAQVHSGLLGLGWSTREADDAVIAVAPLAADAPDVADLLRAALKTLSRA
jgi:Holliday junction DNA helicase RuvA